MDFLPQVEMDEVPEVVSEGPRVLARVTHNQPDDDDPPQRQGFVQRILNRRGQPIRPRLLRLIPENDEAQFQNHH